MSMAIRTAARLLTAAAALTCGSAEAAIQGGLGATSSGSIAITLSVARQVQISGLVDVAFANVSPDAAAVSAQSVCVSSNTATRGYSLLASGDGEGHAFVLSNGAATTPYAVQWSAAAGQASGTRLASDAPLSGLTSSAPGPDCAAATARM